jgi:hypothetical protein
MAPLGGSRTLDTRFRQEAEIEVKTSDKKDLNGQPYINRIVTQVYQDGAQVVKKDSGM